jgi:integrase
MPDSAPFFPNAEVTIAFGNREHLTMAALITRIQADGSLTDVRRRNVASSIRRFCQALDCSPAQVPATFAYFRDRLSRFHPLAVGITTKRWATIKSDVAFALKRAGAVTTALCPRAPLAPEWLTLKNRLPSNIFNWGLSRLARSCGAQGIRPGDVDDEVMEAYYHTMRRETFKTNPNKRHRDMCVLWNKVVDLLPGSGVRKVTLPSYQQTYTLPWDELPAAFREEADAWLATMSSEADLLSEEGPIKPLRPASIKCYRYALRQLVAGLVAKGWALESVDSLAVLVEPKAAEAALRFFLDRNKGRTSTMISRLAHVLVLVAETAVHPGAQDIERLKRFRKQLVDRCYGMRPRPKNALRPFTDTANIEKILMLPQRVHDRQRRKPKLTLADARLMQVALALELLLMRPIRRKNLVDLRLDRHIVRSGRHTFIIIPADEVKNDVELDYPIPPESAVLLDFYVKRVLPLFGPNPMRCLFPGGKPDGSRSAERFSALFIETVKKETGLYLYPHLTRHFGAALYLRENPGAFGVVRLVLGHKSLATTTRSYASFDDDAAVREFDKLVLRIRAEIHKELKDD